MTIILIRHLKVDFRWKPFYDARGFAEACAGYNDAPVVRPLETFTTDRPIWASSMRRAVDTARLLFGREPDRVTDLITEVPEVPFLSTSFRFPRVVWDAFGRLEWLLGVMTQPESYADTVRRVDKFLEGLLAAGKDCVVVSHGWVLKVMIRRLAAIGFRGPRPIYLGNGVPFTYRR
ncbi:MAG: histidine phosphatase family protein [Spirochaetales bacterium]|nr:histidine phosphatase family protein [Spirochaetales bacterium]